MQYPVYRNLDQPFQILGFNVIELLVLCITLVIGGELAQTFSINRVWAVIATIMLAISFLWLRRSLGDLFVRRLLRFINIPTRIYSKIFIIGRY